MTWLHNATIELVSGVGGVLIETDGARSTLSVEATERDSGGSYTCVLENSVGTAMESFGVTILSSELVSSYTSIYRRYLALDPRLKVWVQG